MELTAIHVTHINHATYKKCNNQINNAVEIPRYHDDMYRLRSPLQIYRGFRAPTQLRIVFQQLHCDNSTATTALHFYSTYIVAQTKATTHVGAHVGPQFQELLLDQKVRIWVF